MREVGAEIRRLRQERGWTGAQLAVYAGMAPSAISQIETGRRSPNAGSLEKIAKALDVEVVDLFPKAQSPLPLEPSPGDERGATSREDILRGALENVRSQKRPAQFDEIVRYLSQFSKEDLAELAAIQMTAAPEYRLSEGPDGVEDGRIATYDAFMRELMSKDSNTAAPVND